MWDGMVDVWGGMVDVWGVVLVVMCHCVNDQESIT